MPDLCCLSHRAQRDEAKIIAWESLQKAKADEAIRKLEVLVSSYDIAFNSVYTMDNYLSLCYKLFR